MAMREREEAIREKRQRQPYAELERKASKAWRRQQIWTVEELDFAKAKGARLSAALKWE
jgi:hypothetical protein